MGRIEYFITDTPKQTHTHTHTHLRTGTRKWRKMQAGNGKFWGFCLMCPEGKLCIFTLVKQMFHVSTFPFEWPMGTQNFHHNCLTFSHSRNNNQQQSSQYTDTARSSEPSSGTPWHLQGAVRDSGIFSSSMCPWRSLGPGAVHRLHRRYLRHRLGNVLLGWLCYIGSGYVTLD